MTLHKAFPWRTLTLFLLLTILVGGLLPLGHVQAGSAYYVDSADGSDHNPGTYSRPWRTLSKVESWSLGPGDTVYFKRGGYWNSSDSPALRIRRSGRSGAPITFAAYGSGNAPVLNSRDGWRVISIEADWIVIDGLRIQGSREAGIHIDEGADYNTVTNCRITDTGIGVLIYGTHNRVSHCHIHDLHMIVNTRGGNDDYGANGVFIRGSQTDVCYNRFVNCKAWSYDYDHDGGAVEIYGDVYDTHVYRNWAEDCDGFIEVGGRDGTAHDTDVHYNVILDSERALHFNLGWSSFAADVTDFRFENNTVIQSNGWQPINFIGGELRGDRLVVRNNIFDGFQRLASDTDFVHQYNLYNGIRFRFDLGRGEKLDDPEFADRWDHDFRLRSNSPAVNAGTDIGWNADIDDRPVPQGGRVDMGAYERGSAAAPTATPRPTRTPVPPTPVPGNDNPDDIIIDDTDRRFSTSERQDPWRVYENHGTDRHYGGSHHYNRSRRGGDSATWSFNVARPGEYNVYAWWYSASWRATDVPYSIRHADGTSTVRKNQERDGGQWTLLGTYRFDDRGSVTVSDDVSNGSDIVADAIRVEFVRAVAGPDPAPTRAPEPPPEPELSDSDLILDDDDWRCHFSSNQDAWQYYYSANYPHWNRGHHYNQTAGNGQDTATWDFDIGTPGTFTVYAWWWAGDQRPPDVPYTVEHYYGTDTVRVDQRRNGGQWVYLGTFVFGDGGRVTVSDDVSSGRDLVADGLRIHWVNKSTSRVSISAALDGTLPPAEPAPEGLFTTEPPEQAIPGGMPRQAAPDEPAPEPAGPNRTYR